MLGVCPRAHVQVRGRSGVRAQALDCHRFACRCTPRHLEYMRRRDPFHKNRRRAWLDPERALETLQGYAYLHLLVSKTKETWRDGRASLHFDVFINDERWDAKKRCPMGASIRLHVHSPLSIVRVALMDGDSETGASSRLAKHDLGK